MSPGVTGYAEIAQGVRAGDLACVERLCMQFDAGLRFLLGRFVQPVEASSLAQEVLCAVVRAIRGAEVPDPVDLPALVWAVARPILDQARAGRAEGDQSAVPERRPTERQTERIARAVLQAMPTQDQEVLRRYYLEKQSPERVCAEMNLSPERFRLLRSQAKREFEARLQGRPLENQARAARAAGNAPAV